MKVAAIFTAVAAFQQRPGENCGLNSVTSLSLDPTTKVIKGEEASLGMFPWQAEFRSCQLRGCSICGATLVSDRWLITAGHCSTSSTVASKSSVRLGSTKFGQGGKEYTLETIIRHPGWTGNLLTANDVSVIKTVDQIQFSDYVSPLCLPKEDICLETGSEIWLSGFGKTADDSEVSSSLQYTDLKLISNAECKKYFGVVARNTGSIHFSFDFFTGFICRYMFRKTFLQHF